MEVVTAAQDELMQSLDYKLKTSNTRATGFRPQEKGRGVLLDCAWTRKPD